MLRIINSILTPNGVNPSHAIALLHPVFTVYLPITFKNFRDCSQLARLEADYILACQDTSPTDPAYGAINNVYGAPTWVVPSEVAMATLGLNAASDILNDPRYGVEPNWPLTTSLRCNNLTALGTTNTVMHLPSIQSLRSRTPAQNRLVKLPRSCLRCTSWTTTPTDTMPWKTALSTCWTAKIWSTKAVIMMVYWEPANPQGQFQSWRWMHDNAYAYWALRRPSRGRSERRYFSGFNVCCECPKNSTRHQHLPVRAKHWAFGILRLMRTGIHNGSRICRICPVGFNMRLRCWIYPSPGWTHPGSANGFMAPSNKAMAHASVTLGIGSPG